MKPFKSTRVYNRNSASGSPKQFCLKVPDS